MNTNTIPYYELMADKYKDKTPRPEEPSLTASQCGEIAGVTKETILNYYNRGVLKGYRKGTSGNSGVMIYVSSFEKWMQDRRK